MAEDVQETITQIVAENAVTLYHCRSGRDGAGALANVCRTNSIPHGYLIRMSSPGPAHSYRKERLYEELNPLASMW
jgi:hypothetical protein